MALGRYLSRHRQLVQILGRKQGNKSKGMAINSRSSVAGQKIKDLWELARILEDTRSQGKSIVHCHGVFDLLHLGHIRHFEEAKSKGDTLVVTVTPDRFVNKGPGRPVFGEDFRAEAIASLASVDYVAVNHWPQAVETIRLLRPDYYAKGAEYREAQQDRTGGITSEEAAVVEAGGQITFTDDITFSSSNLINHHMQVFPQQVTDYLNGFSRRFSVDGVLSYLENAQALKVLVVGETIIDEYIYCETLGKSGKDPILAARLVNSEKFAGGVVQIANHVAAFSDNVGMATLLGRGQCYEDFVRENTKDNVDPFFLYTEDESSTIVKQRFVETYPFQRLF